MVQGGRDCDASPFRSDLFVSVRCGEIQKGNGLRAVHWNEEGLRVMGRFDCFILKI